MMGPRALRLGGPEPRGPHGVGAYEYAQFCPQCEQLRTRFVVNVCRGSGTVRATTYE